MHLPARRPIGARFPLQFTWQPGLPVLRTLIACSFSLCLVHAQPKNCPAPPTDLIASRHLSDGRVAEAISAWEVSLAARQRTCGPDHLDCGLNQNQLGRLKVQTGDLRGAAEHFRDAVRIFGLRRGEMHVETLQIRLNLGETLRQLGRHREAAVELEKALTAIDELELKEHLLAATVYGTLASNLYNQGFFGEAENHYRKALHICLQQADSSRRETAAAHANLGTLLAAMGRFESAQTEFRNALHIQHQILRRDHSVEPDHLVSQLNEASGAGSLNPLANEIATIHNNIADLLHTSGKTHQAHSRFQRALELRESALGRNHVDTALVRRNMAVNLQRMGEQEWLADGAYERAESRFMEVQQHLQTAFEILSSTLGNHPDVAIINMDLARCFSALKQFESAADHFRTSIEMLEQTVGATHPTASQARSGLAEVFHCQGEYARAAQQWQTAAEAFETARLRVALTGIGRSMHTAEYSPLQRLSAVRARVGDPQAAWESWESGLARGLLDDLAARRTSDLSPEDQAHQEALHLQLDRFDHISRQASGTETADATDLQELRTTVEGDLRAFQTQLQQKYGVSQGATFALDRIQKSLREDMALISWLDVPGRPESVTPQGEHWCIVLRKTGPPLWRQLDAPSDDWVWELDDPTYQLAEGIRDRHADQQLIAEVRTLRWDPMKSLLKATADLPKARHLVVLPSASMRGVPVEVIVGDEFTVSYAPSGTLFAWLHETSEEPSAGTRDQLSFFGVGDPEFGPETGLAPLPQTLPEVRNIAKLFPPDEVELLTGRAADRRRLDEMAAGRQLKQFSCLHFATHGEANALRPMQSRIRLAGSSYVTASDVLADWELNAEIVTLSACESALGRFAEGEGYLGFSQALLLAGARSLLLSLWKVDDSATSLMMQRFYENLIGHRQPALSRAESLREAKLWLRQLTADDVQRLLGEDSVREQSHPFDDPVYWAAFILVGDTQHLRTPRVR